jgi:hypothetical protein
MIRVDRGCLAAVLLVGLLIPLSTAHAQSAEAEVLFRDGRNLIKRGKVGPGCDKLAASERLESSVGTLLNLGDCREKLGKLASAWAAFRKAEAMAKRAGGDDKRQGEAGRRAAQLEPRLANLVIEVPHRIDGLVVRRDGEVIDAAGWSTPLPVDPGSYTIVAEAPGYLAWRQVVTVASNAKRQVITVPELERAPITPAVESAPMWPPPQAGQASQDRPSRVVTRRGTWSTARVVSVVAGVAGAGALGTGVYFGLDAKDLQDRADERCPLVECNDTEGLRLNDEAQTAAQRANILYIAGGATIAAAAVLWFVGAPGDTMITPTAGKQQYGVSLTGSF